MKETAIPGSYPDVTFHDGQVHLVTMNAGRVEVYRWDGTRFHPVFNAVCEGNGFPCLRSVDGSLWLFYRPQDGRSCVLRNLTTNDERIYEPSDKTNWNVGFYNWPLALGDAGYCCSSLWEWTRVYSYSGEQAGADLPHMPGSGIAYLDGMNRPVSMDDNAGTMSQWGMLNPERTDGLVVGEGQTGGVPCVFEDRIKKVIDEGNAGCFLPKVARNGAAAEWAIVTTDYRTARLFYDVTPADFEGTTPPQPEPGYNPKADLLKIQAELAVVIGKL